MKLRNQKSDPKFLYNLAKAAMGAYDMDFANKVSKEYLATQTDMYTKENLEILSSTTRSTKNEGYKIITANPAKVAEIIGKPESAKRIIKEKALQEIVYPKELLLP